MLPRIEISQTTQSTPPDTTTDTTITLTTSASASPFIPDMSSNTPSSAKPHSLLASSSPETPLRHSRIPAFPHCSRHYRRLRDGVDDILSPQTFHSLPTPTATTRPDLAPRQRSRLPMLFLRFRGSSSLGLPDAGYIAMEDTSED